MQLTSPLGSAAGVRLEARTEAGTQRVGCRGGPAGTLCSPFFAACPVLLPHMHRAAQTRGTVHGRRLCSAGLQRGLEEIPVLSGPQHGASQTTRTAAWTAGELCFSRTERCLPSLVSVFNHPSTPYRKQAYLENMHLFLAR